jgi:hypothetical protein
MLTSVKRSEVAEVPGPEQYPVVLGLLNTTGEFGVEVRVPSLQFGIPSFVTRVPYPVACVGPQEVHVMSVIEPEQVEEHQ